MSYDTVKIEVLLYLEVYSITINKSSDAKIFFPGFTAENDGKFSSLEPPSSTKESKTFFVFFPCLGSFFANFFRSEET